MRDINAYVWIDLLTTDSVLHCILYNALLWHQKHVLIGVSSDNRRIFYRMADSNNFVTLSDARIRHFNREHMHPPPRMFSPGVKT